MPCNNNYMGSSRKEEEDDDDEYDDDDERQPSSTEVLLSKTAKLYLFALKELGHKFSNKVKIAATTKYCRANYVKDLCTLLRSTPKRDRMALLLGDSYEHKALYVWWEEHKEADAIRLKKEELEANKESIVKRAIKKLTEEEITLLKEHWKARC